MTGFREQADTEDPLQIAGDIALNAIKAYLGDVDDLSIVVTISGARRGAQALAFPDDVDEGDYEQRGLMLMLAHAALTAKKLGWNLELMPIDKRFGQG